MNCACLLLRFVYVIVSVKVFVKYDEIPAANISGKMSLFFVRLHLCNNFNEVYGSVRKTSVANITGKKVNNLFPVFAV